MRIALAGAGIFALLCCPARTADTPAQILFNRLRENVRADLTRVPRYTCVQTVTRTQSRPQYGARPATCNGLIEARARLTSPSMLLWHDRLRLDVAVGDGQEMFSWAGARQFETHSLADLALSGSTGTGEFSSFLGSIFGIDGQGFRYAGEQDTPVGRLAAYTFLVPLGKSHYSYRTNNGVSRIIPYSGAFYAVPSTAELKRLVVEATQFTWGDVCQVVDTMDYRRMKVGASDFLLPEVSTMRVIYPSGDETVNETRYSGCHEFSGESTIRFDEPGELNSKPGEAKAELKALPPNTHIQVKIEPPVNSDTAAAGDPIIGVAEREVKAKGETVVRTTDRLHGRILRMEQMMLPEPRWTVAIRFDSIERDGVEQPVSLKPVDDGDRSPQPIRMIGRRMEVVTPRVPPKRPEGTGVFIFGGAGRLVLDQRFHSEWETQ
jgi:hypothetical protein